MDYGSTYEAGTDRVRLLGRLRLALAIHRCRGQTRQSNCYYCCMIQHVSSTAVYCNDVAALSRILRILLAAAVDTDITRRAGREHGDGMLNPQTSHLHTSHTTHPCNEGLVAVAVGFYSSLASASLGLVCRVCSALLCSGCAVRAVRRAAGEGGQRDVMTDCKHGAATPPSRARCVGSR